MKSSSPTTAVILSQGYYVLNFLVCKNGEQKSQRIKTFQIMLHDVNTETVTLGNNHPSISFADASIHYKLKCLSNPTGPNTDRPR